VLYDYSGCVSLYFILIVIKCITNECAYITTNDLGIKERKTGISSIGKWQRDRMITHDPVGHVQIAVKTLCASLLVSTTILCK